MLFGSIKQEVAVEAGFETHVIGDGVSVHEVLIDNGPQYLNKETLDKKPQVEMVVFLGFCEGLETSLVAASNVVKAKEALLARDDYRPERDARVSIVDTEKYGLVSTLYKEEKLGKNPLAALGAWFHDILGDQSRLNEAAAGSVAGPHKALRGETYILGNSLGSVIAQGMATRHGEHQESLGLTEAVNTSNPGNEVELKGVFSFAPAGEQEVRSGIAKVLEPVRMVGGLALDAAIGVSSKKPEDVRQRNAQTAKRLGRVLVKALFNEGLIKSPIMLSRILRELPSGSTDAAGLPENHKIVAGNDHAFPPRRNRFKDHKALSMDTEHSSLASIDGVAVFQYYIARATGDEVVAARIAQENDLKLAYAA